MEDKVTEILLSTNDGDDLTELELKIIEMAVNGQLNDKDKAKFEEIYQKYI